MLEESSQLWFSEYEMLISGENSMPDVRAFAPCGKCYMQMVYIHIRNFLIKMQSLPNHSTKLCLWVWLNLRKGKELCDLYNSFCLSPFLFKVGLIQPMI